MLACRFKVRDPVSPSLCEFVFSSLPLVVLFPSFQRHSVIRYLLYVMRGELEVALTATDDTFHMTPLLWSCALCDLSVCWPACSWQSLRA